MTTTYLRAFTPTDLKAATQALDGRITSHTGEPCPFNEARNAVNTPVNGEALAMPIVCTGWEERRAALGLKVGSVKGEADRAAYMQGALAALAACGLLTQDAINRVTFLSHVGRLDTYMAAQAKKDTQA